LNQGGGLITVKDACNLIGPGSYGRPVYNDILCGNGPANNSEEDPGKCPGRVDVGRAGCGYIGPSWNWDGVDCGAFSASPTPTASPTPSPTASPTESPTISPTVGSDSSDSDSYGVVDHQKQCRYTGYCKKLYRGLNAKDCSNSKGGVCLCGKKQRIVRVSITMITLPTRYRLSCRPLSSIIDTTCSQHC
jgi:hypothetical protein